MDTIDLNQMNAEETSKLELQKNSILYLDETRKWTNFLAILGFVMMGLMVIMGFSFGTIFSKFGGSEFGSPFPGFLFGIIYLIFAVIYFFPILYLFKFSSLIKKAVSSKNSNDLEMAFKNLKAHYRYIGIMMIIVLGIYALFFVIALAGGLLAGFMN